MTISLQCPACGKHHDLRDALAGKRVKCRCGEVITVAASAPESPDSFEEDWIAEALGQPFAATPPPVEPAPDDSSPAPPPEPPQERANERELPERRRQETPNEAQRRRTVGALCVLYGIVMTFGFGAISYIGSFGIFGLFGWVKLLAFAQPFLAVMIAAGGVMILKNDPRGPTCAGLSCLILCFFPAFTVVRAVSLSLLAGHLGKFLLLVLYAAVVYSIPVFVTIWCLKEEAAAQGDSDDMD